MAPFPYEDGIRKIQTFSSGFQDRFRPCYGLISWKYLKNLFESYLIMNKTEIRIN